MVSVVGFPCVGVFPYSLEFDPVPAAANTTIKNTRTTLNEAPGYFKATLQISLHGDAQHLEWQGFLADLNGSSNIFPLVVQTSGKTPKSVTTTEHIGSKRYDRFAPTNTFEDTTTFVDGTVFEGSETPAFFSTSMNPMQSEGFIQLSGGGELRRGQVFQAFNLHQLVMAHETAPGSNLWHTRFQPPLTREHDIEKPVDFDNPLGVFRMVDGEQGRLKSSVRNYTSLSIDIVEAEPTSIAQAFGFTL